MVSLLIDYAHNLMKKHNSTVMNSGNNNFNLLKQIDNLNKLNESLFLNSSLIIA
jgi:hypothetical protein